MLKKSLFVVMVGLGLVLFPQDSFAEGFSSTNVNVQVPGIASVGVASQSCMSCGSYGFTGYPAPMYPIYPMYGQPCGMGQACGVPACGGSFCGGQYQATQVYVGVGFPIARAVVQGTRRVVRGVARGVGRAVHGVKHRVRARRHFRRARRACRVCF